MSNFDEIPSEIHIPPVEPKVPTVTEELEAHSNVLDTRLPKCLNLSKPKRTGGKPKTVLYRYKYVCVCPRYNPNFRCKHTGNIIIDRDVLTKEEHICYLATPKENLGVPHKRPHFYTKKFILSNCTSRIEQLAMPKVIRVRDTFNQFKEFMSERHQATMASHLEEKPPVQYFNMKTALEYMAEERRLEHWARIVEQRRCRRVKRCIRNKQRRQIRQIINIIFEEMRDFLLNDQFLVDERSTLCSVILEQIRAFTDKDFCSTSNLREYQKILANNLTVWINKFISNLNIHISPPQAVVERPDPECFLPVRDFISCSDSVKDTDEGEEETPKTEQTSLNEEEGYYGIALTEQSSSRG